MSIMKPTEQQIADAAKLFSDRSCTSLRQSREAIERFVAMGQCIEQAVRESEPIPAPPAPRKREQSVLTNLDITVALSRNADVRWWVTNDERGPSPSGIPRTVSFTAEQWENFCAALRAKLVATGGPNQ